jgi:hypothetical protein
MKRETDDFASIDMAVAFFSAVLILFVFIQFNFTDRPPQEPVASVGQTVPSVTAIAPSWQTVPRRSGVAILDRERLVVLDMSQVSFGVADRGASSQGAAGWMTWSKSGLASTPPNAFLLEIYTALSTPPAAWVKDEVVLDGDAPCLPDLRPSLIVFATATDTALSPALVFAERCGIDARFEFLDSETDADTITTPLRVGLSPAAYRRERIFR